MDNKLFLFVDFDGILATNEDWVLCRRKNDRFHDIRNRKIQAIEKLIRYDIKCPIYFIPISAWGHAFSNKEILNEFLKEREVSFKAFKNQIYIENHSGEERVKGIQDFIQKYKVKHYLILDDECNDLYKKANIIYVPYNPILHKFHENLIDMIKQISKTIENNDK